MEAMALGRPVVSTRVGGIAEPAADRGQQVVVHRGPGPGQRVADGRDGGDQLNLELLSEAGEPLCAQFNVVEFEECDFALRQIDDFARRQADGVGEFVLNEPGDFADEVAVQLK